jgi:hypothetical protein
VAQQLVPFDQWQARNAKWQDDLSDMSYVGARCSVLFSMVGNYFLLNPGKPEDLETGKSLTGRAKPFLTVSSLIGIRVGMSADALKGRHTTLLEAYSKQLNENKRLHNNLFEEPIFSDFKFCVGNEQLFNVLSKKNL